MTEVFQPEETNAVCSIQMFAQKQDLLYSVDTGEYTFKQTQSMCLNGCTIHLINCSHTYYINSSFHTLLPANMGVNALTLPYWSTTAKNSLHCEVKTFAQGIKG